MNHIQQINQPDNPDHNDIAVCKYFFTFSYFSA